MLVIGIQIEQWIDMDGSDGAWRFKIERNQHGGNNRFRLVVDAPIQVRVGRGKIGPSTPLHNLTEPPGLV